MKKIFNLWGQARQASRALCFIMNKLVSVSIYLLLLLVCPLVLDAEVLPVSEIASNRGYSVNDIAFLRAEEGGEAEVIPTALGPISVYGLSKLQNRFAWSVRDSIARAFSSADQTLKTKSFPQWLRKAGYRWQLFFYDKGGRRSGVLSSGRCHAAQIGPPANIFISVDHLLSDCGKRQLSSVAAKSALGKLLVHEIAHAVEFQLMKEGFSRRKRWHSEGFATWFETLSADVYPESHTSHLYEKARSSLVPDWKPLFFDGSAEDYFRSYALVLTLSEGVPGKDLFAVYEQMSSAHLSFEESLARVFGWNSERLSEEAFLLLENAGYGLGGY